MVLFRKRQIDTFIYIALFILTMSCTSIAANKSVEQSYRDMLKIHPLSEADFHRCFDDKVWMCYAVHNVYSNDSICCLKSERKKEHLFLGGSPLEFCTWHVHDNVLYLYGENTACYPPYVCYTREFEYDESTNQVKFGRHTNSKDDTVKCTILSCNDTLMTMLTRPVFNFERNCIANYAMFRSVSVFDFDQYGGK